MANSSRKRITILPVLVVLLCLAGCGDSTVPVPAPSSAQNTTAPATAFTTTSPGVTTMFNTAVPVSPTPATGVPVRTLKDFYSTNLDNRRTIDVFLPPEYNATTGAKYKVLYANDGQDMESLDLKKTLENLYSRKKIDPIIVVAIYNSDRLYEYGNAGIPDYAGRGTKAGAYTNFLTGEVMPYIKQNFRVLEGPANTAIMGASLGGLSAFDIAWHRPELFGKVGVFSGSFWWRSDDSSNATRQSSRIMHKVVRDSTRRPGLKFWLEAGTLDEASDRDGNGVIDAIQDTTELMDELRLKGYKDKEDMVYVQVEGGKHNQATWAKVLPDLLQWAFPVAP